MYDLQECPNFFFLKVTLKGRGTTLACFNKNAVTAFVVFLTLLISGSAATREPQQSRFNPLIFFKKELSPYLRQVRLSADF